MEERNKEVEKARLNYIENEAICDDICEECAASNGFKKGVQWADSHPSLELVEKIVELAYSWDSISSFEKLAEQIKEELWQQKQ